MNKIFTFAATALAAASVSFSAHATVIDFGAFAIGNERAANATETVNGVNLGFSSNFIAYFDDLSSGLPAGLGVCRDVTMLSQCTDPSDDSIDGELGVDEYVAVAFLDAAFDPTTTNLVGLSFRDGAHNQINDSNGQLTWAVFGAGGALIAGATSSFADLVALAAIGWQGVSSIRLTYFDTDFYLEAVTVSDVPIPAALPLLLSGLAGLGFAARKKKRAAA